MTASQYIKRNTSVFILSIYVDRLINRGATSFYTLDGFPTERSVYSRMVQSGMLVFLVLGISVLALVQGVFHNADVTYSVKLNMYSGRDDPEWNIDSRHALYRDIAYSVNQGPPSSMYKGLGYQGFIVQANNAFGQSAWKTVGRHTNRKLETLLLNSCPSNELSVAASNHIKSCIYGQVATSAYVSIEVSSSDDKKKRRKRQASRVCGTRFDPNNWNYGRVQSRNNCYNYATNRQTNTFAQPGRGSGRKFTRREATDVYSACVRDGLTPLRVPNAGNKCLIALFIWPGEDYHFYRLDTNQYWSQKSGRGRARNVDDSGRRIMDPRNSDRGPYSVFAGWLGVGPNFNIN